MHDYDQLSAEAANRAKSDTNRQSRAEAVRDFVHHPPRHVDRESFDNLVDLVLLNSQGQTAYIESAGSLSDSICGLLTDVSLTVLRLRLELRAMQELADIDPEALEAKIDELRRDDEGLAAERALPPWGAQPDVRKIMGTVAGPW